MFQTAKSRLDGENGPDEPDVGPKPSEPAVPIETILVPPSQMTRYACTSIMIAVLAVWCKYTFVPEQDLAVGTSMHSWRTPLYMTVGYLLGLPLLRLLSKRFLAHNVDVKVLLRESMILYNAAQVALNLWTVYKILHALLVNGHPLYSGPIHLISSGASYAVWVHYCNKYLEFLDTIFMVLRGKMSQVSFLHVYHHTSIAWAWWIGLRFYPGGDIYFGALLNSWIHVMMYSYYTLSLLKISCPWKKSLTMAQLAQFVSVLAYSALSLSSMPEEGNWTHYLAYGTQVFEMTSLFVLFMHFYSKAYSKKNAVAKASSSNDSEASSEAVATASVSSESSDEQFSATES